ncbi:nucleosome assembly protein [Neocallimastix lanati (nom. inval.)]|jgi:nucleosome assembly protein 1-like 1|uniref:Nucleosome assembly protein n=1 Tax=Neocallimastix californiae TaxID=1754190 RepID=A0A1Y2DDN1_9FUNG|nr:nucleosome assembly protein [Neocallimastix sp. JGI-2020a]ORY57370.1 nucleosome assembly protein [Neocallimastix californiae]|eukprot:ORY57370.1 nucleosome assembly protein [Neocallimastix californiae]
MASLKNKLIALKNIHKEQYDIEVQYCNELIEVEKKYMNLLKPYWKKRAEIVSGKYDDSKEIQEEDNDNEYPEFNCLNNIHCKGIPDFWLTVMLHHPKISENITELDIKILSFLKDIRVEYMKENANFRLAFDFMQRSQKDEEIENIYFNNETLYLNFYYVLDNSYGKAEYSHSHVEGTEISWKNINYVEEAVKNKSSSFFMIFYPPHPDDHDNELESNIINETLNQIFEIGEIIKDVLIPQAVDWYTGKALLYSYNEDTEDGSWVGADINDLKIEE